MAKGSVPNTFPGFAVPVAKKQSGRRPCYAWGFRMQLQTVGGNAGVHFVFWPPFLVPGAMGICAARTRGHESQDDDADDFSIWSRGERPHKLSEARASASRDAGDPTAEGLDEDIQQPPMFTSSSTRLMVQAVMRRLMVECQVRKHDTWSRL